MKTMLWGMVATILMGLLIGNAQTADRQIVRRIYFAVDQMAIVPASRLILHEMADLLRANPGQLTGNGGPYGTYTIAYRTADSSPDVIVVDSTVGRMRNTQEQDARRAGFAMEGIESGQ